MDFDEFCHSFDVERYDATIERCSNPECRTCGAYLIDRGHFDGDMHGNVEWVPDLLCPKCDADCFAPITEERTAA